MEEETFLSVRLILTFDQMWMLYPDTNGVTYLPDPDTYIICGNCEVECSDIVKLAVPPSPFSLLKLCTQSNELRTICSQVRLV